MITQRLNRIASELIVGSLRARSGWEVDIDDDVIWATAPNGMTYTVRIDGDFDRAVRELDCRVKSGQHD